MRSVNKWRAGFTLVELLVVIAITAILLGLLLGPLVTGFNLTRKSQAVIQAQNSARLAMETVERELRSAAYIFDNFDRRLRIWARDGAGNMVYSDEPFCIIDLAPPARGNPVAPSNDPTTDVPTGEINLPLAAGRVMVRYFIGLQDNRSAMNNGVWMPVRGYVNGFESNFVAAGQDDNLYLLYRAEFPIYREDGSLNTDLFVDADNDNIPDDFDDPNFFYGPNWQNWQRVAQPVVAAQRADMITLKVDPNGAITEFNPLMQFRPIEVKGQTAAPISDNSLSDEMGDQAAPTQFRLPHGSWANKFDMAIYRSSPDANPVANQTRELFYTSREPNGWMLYHWIQPAGAPNGTAERVANLTEFKRWFLGGPTPTMPPNLWNQMDVSTTQEPAIFLVDEGNGMLQFDIPSWLFAPNGFVYDTDVINQRYVDAIALDPDNAPNIRRFVSLIDSDDNGTIDNPRGNNRNPVAYYSAGVVPGSELVIGPDQSAGPHFGRPIRYTRVAYNSMSVGPNQYRVRYQDLITNAAAPEFNQPRFRRGYIEFTSDPATPLPSGEIVVTFAFQLNRKSDTVVVDYVTRQALNVSMSIKVYDPGSGDAMYYALNTNIEQPNLIRIMGER